MYLTVPAMRWYLSCVPPMPILVLLTYCLAQRQLQNWHLTLHRPWSKLLHHGNRLLRSGGLSSRLYARHELHVQALHAACLPLQQLIYTNQA